MSNNTKTAADVGLSRQEQSVIILSKIISNGGLAQMRDIYKSIEEKMHGAKLSKQGKATLRETVNRYLVNQGYVFPFNRDNRGWRITPQGKIFVDNNLIRKSVHIELEDLNDSDLDKIIETDRLLIGMVSTDTEISLQKRRRGQTRLRELTLLNYSTKCAFCEINEPNLLVASHIVGWAEDPKAQGILSNIICLCRFHDVLFELGYLSLTDAFGILKKRDPKSKTISILLENTINFRNPIKHPPESIFLQRHRKRSGF